MPKNYRWQFSRGPYYVIGTTLLFLGLIWFFNFYQPSVHRTGTSGFSEALNLENYVTYLPINEQTNSPNLFEYLVQMENKALFHSIDQLSIDALKKTNSLILRLDLSPLATLRKPHEDISLYLQNGIIAQTSLAVPLSEDHPAADTSNGYQLTDMIDNVTSVYTTLPSSMSLDRPVYIQLSGTGDIPQLYLQSHHIYMEHQNNLILYYAINTGIVFAMTLTNLVLFYILKERLYVFHAFFLFTIGQYFAASSGILKTLNMRQDYTHLGFWYALTIVATLAFFYQVMKVPERSLWAKGLSHNYLSSLSILVVSGLIIILERMGMLKLNDMTQNIVYASVALESILFTFGIADQLKRAKIQIDELLLTSHRDQLTGLSNRHYFELIYYKMASEAHRYNYPISIILLDLDHFKNINDEHGHDQGDQVLIQTSKIMSEVMRKSDICIRWGGEEFLILLPKTTLDGASVLAEKLRSAIEENSFGDLCKVTASFGVVEKIQSETYDQWYSRVDMALYKAKREGRNRVVPSYDYAESLLEYPFARVSWQTAYECGHPVIDEQHRTLFEKINKLLLAFQKSGNPNFTLEELDDLFHYTQEHFAQEERILYHSGFSQTNTHTKVHNALLQEAQSFRARFVLGEITKKDLYALVYGDIIMGHLIEEDFGYFKHIRNWQNRR